MYLHHKNLLRNAIPARYIINTERNPTSVSITKLFVVIENLSAVTDMIITGDPNIAIYKWQKLSCHLANFV